MNPYIGELRIYTDEFVSRNGPWGSGPDDSKELILRYTFRSQVTYIQCRELNVNGRRFSVLIFNFCFCQCSFAVRAPVNSLLTLVNVALVGHSAKYFQLLGFQMRIEGYIRMFKVADNAHADEVFSLDVDPSLSIGKALFTELKWSHGGSVFTGFLQYCIFNRKAMGIPARHVMSSIALHELVADNDILQCLIQRMTDVNLAVGIWRSIMQYKSRSAVFFSLFQTLMIQVHILPHFYKAWFSFRKIATHREICFWQVQSLAVIHNLFLLKKKIPPR